MSTASKWFVPPDVYFASIEDYAVVGESAVYVKNNLIEYPEHRALAVYDSTPVCPGVRERHPDMGDIFRLFVDDEHNRDDEGLRLLYADVDRDNEEHQQRVRDAAMAGFVEAESTDVQEAIRGIVERWAMRAKHEQPEDIREERMAMHEEAFEDEARRGTVGYIHKHLIDHVLGLKSEEDRRRVLMIISRQHRRKSPRPVLLLLDMIDKFSPGAKEGWLIGYDFYADKIIIKPYHAVEGTGSEHPLTEKWDIQLPDDGVSWKGHPVDFVAHELPQLLKEIDDHEEREQESKSKSQTYGFKLLAYHTVTRWIHRHWDAMTSVKPAESEVAYCSADELEGFEDRIQAEAEKFTFTDQTPDKEDDPLMLLFKNMQRALEVLETAVQYEVHGAKEAGKEDMALNAAKLYKRGVEQLRSFNLNPEKPM
ncbi:MAG: hypothetical protein LQ339_007013 [Xanthoria mediterranea]|nr:MAG: hypothetical protein LQ339_007013 [Xanthoria mediterranea]